MGALHNTYLEGHETLRQVKVEFARPPRIREDHLTDIHG